MDRGSAPAPKRRGLKLCFAPPLFPAPSRECSRPETKGIETLISEIRCASRPSWECSRPETKGIETHLDWNHPARSLAGSAPAPKRRGLKRLYGHSCGTVGGSGSAPAPKRRGLKRGQPRHQPTAKQRECSRPETKGIETKLESVEMGQLIVVGVLPPRNEGD